MADEHPEVTDERKAQAEAAKNDANAKFKDKHYVAAVDGYTRAIELDPTNAVYYGNRAFAHIRLENYGSAVADADKAIELDPKYIKAYYRRADAHFLLCKFKDALKDFRIAARVAPNDPDLRKKLVECEKAVKRIRFEEALARPEDYKKGFDTAKELCRSMAVPEEYKGPRMAGSEEEGWRVTRDFVLEMVREFKEQKSIHPRFAFEILFQADEILRKLPSLVDLDTPDGKHVTVCGDVHGQFYDLLRIFEMNGMPSNENPYLFNGDFVDRGSFSVEVMFTLLAFKVADPDSMHLTRGNHETRTMNKIYGFEGEVKAKFTALMAEVFSELFCHLPIAYVLNKKVFVVHGGLHEKDGVKLSDIRNIDRDREPPEGGLMCDLLWSDPHDGLGRAPSKRGTGVQFGKDMTKRFLEENGLSLVVRSHEVKEEGYEVQHDGYCITVFSAPNYCDQMGNKGAFIRFTAPDMAPHPPVRPMAYANPFLTMSMMGS